MWSGALTPSTRTTTALAAMNNVTANFPVERLWEKYSFDPLNGKFHKRTASGKAIKGWWSGRGFCLQLPSWNGRKITTSYGRAVNAWVAGEWAPDCVDHIDRNPSNNRAWNLRLATIRGNSWNTKKFTGALKPYSNQKGQKRWRAAIRVEGKQHHLGYYSSEEKASSAYWDEYTRRFGGTTSKDLS